MLYQFRAEISEATESTMTARLVPFGEAVEYGGGTVKFEAGSVRIPDQVPLTIDHGDSVLDRIGVLTRSFETQDGLYAEFKISDVPSGQTVRALLADGALTDVSVGVQVEQSTHAADETMTGTLDHVSVVVHGRFGRSENPSKVLAVHDEGEPQMAEDTKEAVAPVAAFDDSELKAEILRLSEQVDTFENRVVEEPAIFATPGEYVQALVAAGKGDNDASNKLEKFALAVDTTTTAAGVVPDFLSTEYLSIIATSRAFVGNIPNDAIGTSGMSVVYPKRTSGPSVAVQATENLEVDSTALVIGVESVDLLTFAGANKVSQQLITRSSPAFVDILFRELASQYSQVTDAASIATAVAAVGDTAILADLGADAAATFAAFSLANSVIIGGVRAPADTVWLAPDRWAQLNSLVDGDGRPLLVFGANGPMNAQGQSSFNTMVAQYHGWIVRLDPDAATGTCLIAWTPSYANLESSPTQLSALQVDTLSTDLGIWGLQNIVVKFPDGTYSLTLA